MEEEELAAACEGGCDVFAGALADEPSPASVTPWLVLALVDFSTLIEEGDSTLVWMMSKERRAILLS